MKGHTFVDTNGDRQGCLYPEGRDPLLASWRAGDCETHPQWNDALFWAEVARLKAQDDFHSARQMAKKKARTEAQAI